jgi:DNA-binding GntR family transcriptional regulator
MATNLDRRWAEITRREGDVRERLLEVRKLHMRFHMQVAEASGYPALCQAIEKNQVLVFATLYDALLGDQTEPAHWHGALMEALARRNPDTAEAAMRHHVREGLDMLLERLEPYLTWDRSKLPLERSGGKNGRH